MKNKYQIYFISLYSFILLILGIAIFFPVYTSKHLLFPYAIHPFDLCTQTPSLWKILKILFFIFYILSSIIISNFINLKYNSKILKNNTDTHKPTNSLINSDLNLLIGYTETNTPIYLCEKSLYQNLLITGTIGTGKTSSAMYPFTRSTN